MTTVAERIKSRRKALNMTQVVLAEKAGIKQAHISRYEKGLSEPLASNVFSLAQALEVSSEWLLGITDEPPDTPQTDGALNDEEKELVNLYRATADRRKPKIIEIVRLAQ